ncbi:MAG: hypothetical protein ACRBBS_13695 [Thalassovita sp.]
MTLEAILKDTGISNVLIVDDCFDEVPLANDLADIDAEWSNFHDDWTEGIEAVLAKAYEGNLDEPHQLRMDDEYIRALWKSRSDVGAEAIFAAYEATQRLDNEVAGRLETYLTQLGLSCTKVGRSFTEPEVVPDLIVIDLFLGAAQEPGAAELSKEGLRQIVGQHGPNMPPVILFSNSTRLASNKEEYRDHVGLLESGFRILAKSQLQTDRALNRQLERLATNRSETRALANFLAALEAGMADASQRTLALMRGVNLSDLSQLRQLLLEFEGKSMGAYLVDVFDRVLQHEIEGQEAIIGAANELSKIDDLSPGPPYIAGAIKTQDLVARMISQAEARLPLAGSDEFPVVFGDIFVWENSDVVEEANSNLGEQEPVAANGTEVAGEEIQEDDSTEVFLVLTPACDLARGAAESALLLKGRSCKITDQSWLYKGDRSPAISINGNLCRIDWDLQSYTTKTLAEIKEGIAGSKIVRVARLRQPHALELQQKLLTSLGRVGLPAPMPATIQTTINAYFYGPDLRRRNLNVLDLSEGSACFVGRDKRANRVVNLVLSETACENILKALDVVTEDDVHTNGKPSLKAISESSELLQILEAGIQLNSPNEGTAKEIKIVSKGGQVPVLHIAWNGPSPADELPAGNKFLKGLVFHVQTQSAVAEGGNHKADQN